MYEGVPIKVENDAAELLALYAACGGPHVLVVFAPDISGWLLCEPLSACRAPSFGPQAGVRSHQYCGGCVVFWQEDLLRHKRVVLNCFFHTPRMATDAAGPGAVIVPQFVSHYRLADRRVSLCAWCACVVFSIIVWAFWLKVW